MGGSTALKIKTNDRLSVPRHRRKTPAERERGRECVFPVGKSSHAKEGRARRTLMAMI
jgi:hypothetical protein